MQTHSSHYLENIKNITIKHVNIYKVYKAKSHSMKITQNNEQPCVKNHTKITQFALLNFGWVPSLLEIFGKMHKICYGKTLEN